MSYNTTLIYPEIVLGANKDNFENIALRVFHSQHEHNTVYRRYCDALRVDAMSVKQLTGIPFLPVSFFKTHTVITGKPGDAMHADASDAIIFESSSTTGDIPSKHYIRDPFMYESALLRGFEQFYGPCSGYAILALLPSYLERKNASLVYMARTLMERSGHEDNGFYINEWKELKEVLLKLGRNGQKTLLLGVTFALLDFAAAYPMPLAHTTVMETGGMKGRREELTRSEVHELLKRQWQLTQVHSEYGMTELLSQAYAPADGVFKCTDTMRVFARDMNDPLDVKKEGMGCINIIDLANIYSCSFIATDDIGNIHKDGSFEVLGRMDNSDLRGCSLMAV